MICERMHEWLALDLYGELADGERTALAEHLTHCSACRAFRTQLARGLGALAPSAPMGDTSATRVARNASNDLPSGWDEALARAVGSLAAGPVRTSTAPRARHYSLVAPLAFAAGVLVSAAIVSLERRNEPELSTPLVPTEERFVAHSAGPAWIESSTPPPPTTTTGPLALAATYLHDSRSR